MNISNFKQGDIITRTEPAKPYSPGKSGDRSYMGDKLTFIGIANGQIYFQMIDHPVFPDNDKLYDLSLDIWSEGWVLFQDPIELFNLKKESNLSLEEQLELALEKEDYKLASEIRNKLNK